jgi:hypothetical protein
VSAPTDELNPGDLVRMLHAFRHVMHPFHHAARATWHAAKHTTLHGPISPGMLRLAVLVLVLVALDALRSYVVARRAVTPQEAGGRTIRVPTARRRRPQPSPED